MIHFTDNKAFSKKCRKQKLLAGAFLLLTRMKDNVYVSPNYSDHSQKVLLHNY